MTDMLKTIDPTTGNPLKSYPLMTDDVVTRTILDCQTAFDNWRKRSASDRAKVLVKIGRGLRDNKDALARLMTQEMGKLLSQSYQEIDLCAGICDWTAAHGPDHLKDETRDLEGGGKGRIVFAPLGVIYGIQPWNYPAYQVVRYSIANLMAGNGVLLKHAENVTGTGEMLVRIYREAGLPEGLFAQLTISHDQSNDVIAHDLVRGVTLTGSPDAGRAVGKLAGAALKKTVLELGSNDAYIVLDDADLELAVKMCVQGRIYNNGETCIAAKRFVVVDAIYDQFKTAFVAAMKDIRTGDPMRDDVDLGPMARGDLRDTLHEQVEKSVAAGARILCGGTMPDGPGYYYPATVLEDVTPGQPAYDDELFGPVAALIRARDTTDAMRIANDSRFGLGGGIFSRDVATATALVAQEFDTGMVFVNGFGLATPSMPFGGVKNSGYGREHGGFGMREFVNVKAIAISD
jgi:succinate-semialdehyde dehydrogenase/glutarate-semialdehyde dehydrogenase